MQSDAVAVGCCAVGSASEGARLGTRQQKSVGGENVGEAHAIQPEEEAAGPSPDSFPPSGRPFSSSFRKQLSRRTAHGCLAGRWMRCTQADGHFSHDTVMHVRAHIPLRMLYKSSSPLTL